MMRNFGLIACSMLYTLSTFLMLGKQDGMGKEACLLIVISGVVFVFIDALLSFLKQGVWLDAYARYATWLRWLVFLAALPFLLVELVHLAFGSPFMIMMTTLENTPVVMLAAVLLFSGLVLAMLKEDRLRSMSALLGWVFLLGFAFLLLVGWQMASHTVLPFAPLHYPQLNQAIWYYVFSLFVHIAVVNALGDVSERKYVRYGVLIASAIYGIVYFGNLYLLDYRLVGQFHFPTITSSALMSYGHFLQRLELIAVIGILLCDVMKVTILLRFLYRLARVFMKQMMTRWLLVVSCGLLVILGVFWFPSFDVWYAMSPSILLFFGSGCLVLWIVS